MVDAAVKVAVVAPMRMVHMPKYFVCDLDGTLLIDGVIREKDLLKFDAFVNSGHKLILNTGRSASLIKHLMNTLPISYAICCNGNYIVDNDYNVVYKTHGSIEELNTIIKNITTEVSVAASNGIEHEKVKGEVEIKDAMFLSISAKSRRSKDTLKIVEQVTPFLNEFEVVCNQHYVDVGVKHNNKATGIKLIQELLNIKTEDIYVFGDNLNDIPMFQAYYENSYAIKSGNKEARSRAKHRLEYVTDLIPDIELADIH